jgi:hypothetical protein
LPHRLPDCEKAALTPSTPRHTGKEPFYGSTLANLACAFWVDCGSFFLYIIIRDSFERLRASLQAGKHAAEVSKQK